MGEFHETAFIQDSNSDVETCSVIEGSIEDCKVLNGTITMSYIITNQSVVNVADNILLYILGSLSANTSIVESSDEVLR